MPVYPVVDSSMLREAAKRVKEIEPQIRKDLIKNLKGDLQPFAASIKGDIPPKSKPPIRGFAHAGRTRWGSVQASVYVTPSGGKGSIARMEIFGRGDARAGFKIADLAGTSNFTSQVRGEVMNEALQQAFPLSANNKGGRFAWAGFMKYRPVFIAITMKRLEEYAEQINARLFK